MQLGWIDFSRNERNKIMQTLKMLEKSTALDELGIGVIRDRYADILFPGISTLQERAKYFVLIPYLFALAENEKFRKAIDVLPWIHRQEDLLVPTLEKNSKDHSGIIGRLTHKRGRSVKIKPSSIYWNGIRTYEILMDEQLSISNVCGIIYEKQSRKNSVTIKTETNRRDGEGFDDETALNENMPLFSTSMPGYNLMTGAAIELTKEESKYLYKKMTTAAKSRDSLLAYMLKEKCLLPKFDDINTALLPEKLRIVVQLAKDFADFIVGAHIRYNVIFSRSLEGNEDLAMSEKYREWQGQFPFNSFNLEAVLTNVNCDPGLRVFLEKFYEASKNRNDDIVDKLIIQREKVKKMDRSKLNNPQEYRYNSESPIHNYKLDYRYGTALTIVRDILDGMEG